MDVQLRNLERILTANPGDKAARERLVDYYAASGRLTKFSEEYLQERKNFITWAHTVLAGLNAGNQEVIRDFCRRINNAAHKGVPDYIKWRVKLLSYMSNPNSVAGAIASAELMMLKEVERGTVV